MGMTLAMQTFMPLILIGIGLQWLQRKLAY